MKGNGRIRLEVRDPLLTLQANSTYNWPFDLEARITTYEDAERFKERCWTMDWWVQ